MSKPKKAWLHKANDNYYTDEQFQKEVAHQPWLVKSYIPFVEEVAAAGEKVINQHVETFLKLRISELEDEIKTLTHSGRQGELEKANVSLAEEVETWKQKYLEARKSGYEEGYDDCLEESKK